MSVTSDKPSEPRRIVGIIPAGGRATRLAPLACSKEILPVGLVTDAHSGEHRSKVVSEYLIDSFRVAGINTAYVIIAPEKLDIPAHFGNGAELGVQLAYVVRHLPYGVPYTLDAAFPFVQDVRVAFGFPDIIFQPGNAIEELVARQNETGADIVLGVFPIDDPEKWDCVDFDSRQRIRRVVTKPHNEATGYTWVLAVWTITFTHFIHRFVNGEPTSGDVSFGIVIQSALESGLAVDYVVFERGSCLDIGTPEDLERARNLPSRIS